jgi:predicted GTPase
MLTKIVLVVSLCSSVSMQAVQKRVEELKKANPGAKVSLSLDKKCKIDHKD